MEKICSITGCDKPSRARGWCQHHYDRWHTFGDPLKTGDSAKENFERDGKRRCKLCNTWKEKIMFRKMYGSKNGTEWYSRKCKKCVPTKYKISEARRVKRIQRRMTLRKQARLIRNIIFQEETPRIKSLWDGVGKWARQYDACIECNSNLYKHTSHGLCKNCYSRLTWQALPEGKRKKHYSSMDGKLQEIRRKKDLLLLRRAEAGEFPDFRIQNILATLK